MGALQAVRIIAVVCTGLLAGIYFGYRAGVYHALQELTATNFVRFQRVVHVRYIKVLPVLLLGALIASVLWLVMIWSQFGSAEFWLVAVSCAGIVLVGAMTRAVNIPLNKQLMTWNVDTPPSNLKELWAPWDRVNTIRTLVATTVLILETVALSLAPIAA
jgi:uncharacterized membrane protein